MLAAPDPSTNYLAARDRRDPASGMWWMTDKRYHAWKDASQSLIWLHGIRAFGPSHL